MFEHFSHRCDKRGSFAVGRESDHRRHFEEREVVGGSRVQLLHFIVEEKNQQRVHGCGRFDHGLADASGDLVTAQTQSQVAVRGYCTALV